MEEKIDNNKKIDKECFIQWLSFIQNIINRMSSMSCTCKISCVTLFTALAALYISLRFNVFIIFSGIIVTIVCGAMDCYYLNLEQAYRTRYDDVMKKWQTENLSERDIFNLDTPNCPSFWRVCNSPSILPFYGTILLLNLIIIFKGN